MKRGTVVSVNISAGGVPKLPVDSVMVGLDSIEGDGHNDRKHHGGPERAVCLYSAELIAGLRGEGHPIEAGWAGENFTISGIDWSLMQPGVRLTIGAAEIELTAYTTPCKTIRASFTSGNFVRISHTMNPGWSRVYGKVLVAGRVARGDHVELTGP